MGAIDNWYTLNLQPSGHLAIAEDPAPYEPADRTAMNRHGETLRLAMSLVDGATLQCADREAHAAQMRSRASRASSIPPPPADDAGLVARLHRLERTGGRALVEQLRLLVAFDDRKLWQATGCRDCIHWLDRNLGLGRVAGSERLRVARALTGLPLIDSLFALNQLGYSKVRELTRVADAETERELAAAVMDLSASETADFCRRFRFRQADDAGGTGDDEREASDAMRALDERGVTVRDLGRGRHRLTVDLPTDLAAEFLKVLECMEDQLREGDDEPTGTDDGSLVGPRTARQWRADALLHLSRKALAHAGEAIAKADRYRVLLAAPVSVLDGTSQSNVPDAGPAERPTLIGFGPIASATARRLCETATMTVLAKVVGGEVVGVSHDTRLWPRPMVRAITERDRCCQMPGCTRTRFGQLHHVVTVADRGPTSVTNGALVCSSCHAALHEGGFRLERVTIDDIDLGENAEQLLGGSTDEPDDTARIRTRERVVALQRFRLLAPDGRIVAGPKRRTAPGGVSTWKPAKASAAAA